MAINGETWDELPTILFQSLDEGLYLSFFCCIVFSWFPMTKSKFYDGKYKLLVYESLIGGFLYI